MKTRLFLTCEHAQARVPAAYRALFASAAATAALRSHQGIDIGARLLARRLAKAMRAPLVECAWTRLLVDTNRSPDNPRVFSEFTRDLAPAERAELLAEYHAPYRAEVRTQLAREIASRERVLHVGVHSFTPRWKGRDREIDVAFLYDPKRPEEQAIALQWQRALLAADPALRVRRNVPYRGDSDGLTTVLRREHPASRYLGLELECSQALSSESGPRARLAGQLVRTLTEILAYQ